MWARTPGPTCAAHRSCNGASRTRPAPGGLLEGVGFTADAFGWPNSIKRIALLLLLIGLPIVVVLAWYHGDRGEQRVTGAELTILTLLFLLGGGLFWLSYDRVSAEPSAMHSQPTADRRASIAGSLVTLPDRPSLAVLPFDSFGGSSESSYFADGLTEDIITDLSKLSGILAIARNSSWTYKGKSVKVQQVAKDLGVRYVQEGSVRRGFPAWEERRYPIETSAAN